MKLGLIAGNRMFPLLFSQRAKEANGASQITAICFKGETSKKINALVDTAHWIEVGQLGKVIEIIRGTDIEHWVMAGQISPYRIFRRKCWDAEMHKLVQRTSDFRPHSIFLKLVERLEEEGITFLPSITHMENDLADEGLMSGVRLSDDAINRDIAFGLKIASCYLDLDVGQTLVVKNKAGVALEGLEGTDNTIRRGYRIAGAGCTVLKFSKKNQDLRFDVPVVGVRTLKLIKRVKAAALVLETKRVIILEKERFLKCASLWQIPVVGGSLCESK